MVIKTSATNDITWAALKAMVDSGTIAQGDLIIFNLNNGEEVAVRATQEQGKDGKWFFVLEDGLATVHCMNKYPTNEGGWAASEMRTWLNNDVFPLLPDELQALIKPTKIVQIVDGKRVETEDKLFLLSKTQVFGKGSWSKNEPEDAQLLCFLREKDRVKECGDYGTWWWWLRSPEASSSSAFANVYSNGNSNSHFASGSIGVAFGFCI